MATALHAHVQDTTTQSLSCRHRVVRYLAEINGAIREYNRRTEEQSVIATKLCTSSTACWRNCLPTSASCRWRKKNTMAAFPTCKKAHRRTAGAGGPVSVNRTTLNTMSGKDHQAAAASLSFPARLFREPAVPRFSTGAGDPALASAAVIELPGSIPTWLVFLSLNGLKKIHEDVRKQGAVLSAPTNVYYVSRLTSPPNG